MDITLVEGAVSSEEDLHKIQAIRAAHEILVSLAIAPSRPTFPAMRNPFPSGGYDRAYREKATLDPGTPSQVLPRYCPIRGPFTKWCRWMFMFLAVRHRPT